jgi:excisionase family DNA binding protein
MGMKLTPVYDMMISVREAARRMGISPRRVQVLIGEGRIPAFQVGKAFIVTGLNHEDRRVGRPRKKAAEKAPRSA